MLLMLVWMRAAVIIYALFFGVRPFPGLDETAMILLTQPVGWAMLIVGTAVGALFAALSFSISIFAVPILLDDRSEEHTSELQSLLRLSSAVFCLKINYTVNIYSLSVY